MLSGRWFASTVHVYDSLRLAVSTGSNPAGLWNVWEIKSQNGGTGFEYDQLGLSADKVVI